MIQVLLLPLLNADIISCKVNYTESHHYALQIPLQGDVERGRRGRGMLYPEQFSSHNAVRQKPSFTLRLTPMFNLEQGSQTKMSWGLCYPCHLIGRSTGGSDYIILTCSGWLYATGPLATFRPQEFETRD